MSNLKVFTNEKNISVTVFSLDIDNSQKYHYKSLTPEMYFIVHKIEKLTK